MPRPIITLTTDFGEGSPYVAEMKGVIVSLAPEARIIDITHSVPPQDVRQGAMVLEQTSLRFPPGSIHVAVIDPGVGTQRRIAYAAINGRRYIAPDNGLLGLLARRCAPTTMISLTNPAYWREEVSNTFHGRDIMAPAAAHLALGVAPEELGDPLAALTPLDWPEPTVAADRIEGEICTIDAFGNLITNIEAGHLTQLGPPANLRVSCAGRTIQTLNKTYGESPPGALVTLIGSNGRLEIAVNGGSAKSHLNADAGESVVVTSSRGAPTSASGDC